MATYLEPSALSYLQSDAQFSSVQFSSVQGGISALGNAHMRSAPFFNRLPKVAFDTVPTLVWLMTALSLPFRVDHRPIPLCTPLIWGLLEEMRNRWQRLTVVIRKIRFKPRTSGQITWRFSQKFISFRSDAAFLHILVYVPTPNHTACQRFYTSVLPLSQFLWRHFR